MPLPKKTQISREVEKKKKKLNSKEELTNVKMQIMKKVIDMKN